VIDDCVKFSSWRKLEDRTTVGRGNNREVLICNNDCYDSHGGHLTVKSAKSAKYVVKWVTGIASSVCQICHLSLFIHIGWINYWMTSRSLGGIYVTQISPRMFHAEMPSTNFKFGGLRDFP